ncbi:ParA family protein [Bradyrhizobium sp. LjRoot220]|uniref:nucleotide-binding protein n=1 Tax=Bradyrhizobium sp. LjRoot220 TaxID=3342284 RepID=UPI003ED0D28F
MQTIVLATQKGGSGKSTLAIGLALAAIQAGHTVRLIETDSQGTLSNWQARRPYAEPIVEPVYVAGDVDQRLQSLDRDGVTLTIIDTSGGVSAATTTAIRHADLCLIPARPTVADIEATASTLGVVRAWNKPFAFILNQTPIRGQRLTTAANALSEEAALDISGVVATPFIVMRNDHQDALSAGLAVNEYAPGSKSAEEIRGLWQWVEAKLNAGATVQEVLVGELLEAPLATMFVETPAEAAAFVA